MSTVKELIEVKGQLNQEYEKLQKQQEDIKKQLAKIHRDKALIQQQIQKKSLQPLFVGRSEEEENHIKLVPVYDEDENTLTFSLRIYHSTPKGNGRYFNIFNVEPMWLKHEIIDLINKLKKLNEALEKMEEKGEFCFYSKNE
jgi:chromosome segregation ATPase